MPTEHQIQQRIRAILNAPGSGVRTWRNNTGKLKDARGVWVSFGLAVGSADLIGIHEILVTPEMVGTTIGQFFSCEVKTSTGIVSKEQEVWAETIRRLGGKAVTWRSESDATAFVSN